ncbi:MAG: sulfatase, partial [Ignavibacteriales bacterium]|nr:sulfatase [Ignavibacteriales bacterium]
MTSVEILLASYTKILREYLAFPVNIFESDWGSAKVLISDYLGITALLPAFIVPILFVSALFIPKNIKISNKIKLAGLIIIVIIFAFTLQRPSPQPLVFSLQKKIESVLKSEKRVVPSLTRSYSSPTKVDNQNTLIFSTREITKYNHVIVIVLEGVTSKDFEQEFLTIPNGFYQQHKSDAVYYKNYYATNLDSYTSLISMVTAVQVPYRAYADERLFNGVNNAPSITQDLHNREFYTIFISTYEYQPFVPTRSYWDKIYDRRDLLSINNWLSLGSNRMESATEDKAALSTITDNLKSHHKTFVLHELVYGHSPEWRAKTGKTQLSYYNEYLIDLSEKLKEENLLNKTLFVVVSDHGDRAKSSEIDNYRVPLLVVGDNIPYQSREELFTHL